TSASACVVCALCCKVTSVLSESFDFICCSTCANSTSCWVNWLVSIGLSGSWFCNCVVSSCRNSVKLLAISVLSTVLVAALLEEVVGTVAEVTVMAGSSDSNVDAAAHPGVAGIAARDRGGGKGVVLDHDLRRGGHRHIGLLLAAALVAQRELQAVVGGFQARILQCALEAGRVAAQKIERIGTIDGQVRGHLAVLVDIETHVDAAKLGRIEADLEAVLAGQRFAGNLDRDPGNRDCRGLRGRRSSGLSGCRLAVRRGGRQRLRGVRSLGRRGVGVARADGDVGRVGPMLR